jgi:hypothetical protein
MVKSEKSKNKEEIKYLKKILEKVRELNAKADHLITVFRERYYTPFNCPYADFKYKNDLHNGNNNNNNYGNNNEK